ncbi:hypothetical protein PWT90_05864 [Aphanocladium album]|nr:hypothetical protein PWT90_05864 [Aphanocladium album]
MKILCLHGAYGSARAFRTQLHPFINELEQSQFEFKFVDGQFETEPPEGFHDYFGPAPWFRNIDHDGVNNLNDMVEKLRTHTVGESYEESLRSLMKKSDGFVFNSLLEKTLCRIEQYLDEDPEIRGILGYSEGATAAASYLIREEALEREHGHPRRLKFGIFFSGWPPGRVENGKVVPILADECDQLIEVPTCHIMGSMDPYLYGAMALFSVCNGNTATLFDHGKGHTVPRDDTTVKELASAIRFTIASAT